MSKLPDRYNPAESEPKQHKFWDEKKIYKWQNDLPKNQTFVIDTPPPTVSGLLHMGHIFSYTQADFVARYKRMKGFDVFYPMGFDDNGLPTERLVEKAIGKKAGVYEAENGRGSFVRECQKIVDEAETQFENLFNTIALSVDWDQKYQTISKESQKISQASFVDLYNKGFVEQQYMPVIWDTIDQTSLSQADLIDKEMDGTEINFNFTVSSNFDDKKIIDKFITENDGKLIKVMTTRPELLPSCVALMIHPESEFGKEINLDKNFEGKIGLNAKTPLFNIRVPIISDLDVDPEKGTGAVMCCTYGDETDIKWTKKYNLPERVIIADYDGFDKERFDWRNLCSVFDVRDLSGMKDKNDLSQYEHLDILNNDKESEGNKVQRLYFDENGRSFKIKAVRSNIIKYLEENKILLTAPKQIRRSVKCAERSGEDVQYKSKKQWFIKILDKKEALKEKANECKWYPEFMKIRVEQWIDNLGWDWCISRQRYFGVPFPIWYSKRKGEEGKILVASFDQLPIDPQKDLPAGYNADEVEAETDIMDTWATSSISPQLSSKGISKDFCIDKQRHEKLFPADMRPQAHEIIRTWAFYTIVKAMLHEDKIPWKSLMISGWCLAADKTKMSKSKGNVITPQSLIEEKGADVVRYWASASNLGADIAYSEELFKIGGKLITKLFNASKFVTQNFVSMEFEPTTAKKDIEKNIINEKADVWIISRLQQTIKKYEDEFEEFEYARARAVVEDFFWNDFCDNYLEIVKVRSYGLAAERYKDLELTDEERAKIFAGQQSGLVALYHCLEALLKLFAPFIPHVTEELYQAIFPNKLASIHQRGSACKLEDYIIDQDAISVGEVALQVIFNIRKFKSDNNLSMKTPLKQFVVNSKIDISAIISDLQNVCNTWKILVEENDQNNLVSNIELEISAESRED